jgi:hypothetical protein
MKLKNYKVKIKYLTFESLKQKSEYTKEDIMYLYYDIQFKSKQYKFSYSSGDLGTSLLSILENLKDLIMDSPDLPHIDFNGSNLSIISNLSSLDSATGDSSITCFKFNNEYHLFLANPKGKSLTLILSKIQLMSFINFIDKALHSMLDFQGKLDAIILEVGKDKFDYSRYEEVVDWLEIGKNKYEILEMMNNE